MSKRPKVNNFCALVYAFVAKATKSLISNESLVEEKHSHGVRQFLLTVSWETQRLGQHTCQRPCISEGPKSNARVESRALEGHRFSSKSPRVENRDEGVANCLARL